MNSRIRQSVQTVRERAARSKAYVRMRKKRFIALLITLAHVAGALTSVEAISQPRSSQGAVAWAVSLNTIPYFAVPLYWMIGNQAFSGYETKRHATRSETSPLVNLTIDQVNSGGFALKDDGVHRLQERISNLPATTGNAVELLHQGEAIFDSILEGIRMAETYVLVQFYIVRDDDLGRRFQAALIAAADRGVRVHFIYDGIGSHKLPGSYLSALRDAGVAVNGFNKLTGLMTRFQINFRNHRKIVIVDGRHAWVGGANVGDEYLGMDSDYTPWHDTMIKITGPAVQLIQVPFLEDWFWTDGELLELDWTPQAAPDGTDLTVLCLPTGPADELETCALYFLNAINNATERVWIASPYFVPDEQIVSALQLAAMRGVDVRVILPENCDSTLVRWSGWSYIAPLESAGVKVYRHIDGFLHRKVMLVDRHTSSIGTANFDNRSFRLNFEIIMEVHDESFAREVEAMFLRDLEGSRLASSEELAARSFVFRLAVRVARLLSPLQ